MKDESINVYCPSCSEEAGCIPENNAQEGRVFECFTIGCEKEGREIFPSKAFYDREDREQSDIDNAYIEYLLSQEQTFVDPTTGTRYVLMD